MMSVTVAAGRLRSTGRLAGCECWQVALASKAGQERSVVPTAPTKPPRKDDGLSIGVSPSQGFHINALPFSGVGDLFASTPTSPCRVRVQDGIGRITSSCSQLIARPYSWEKTIVRRTACQ